jgi:hypothetical protein
MVIRFCLCLLLGYVALRAEQAAPRIAPPVNPLQQAVERAMPSPFPGRVGGLAGSTWTPTINLPPLQGPARLASGIVTFCAIPLTRVPMPTDRNFSINRIPLQGKTLDRMTKQPPVKACEETASTKTPR